MRADRQYAATERKIRLFERAVRQIWDTSSIEGKQLAAYYANHIALLRVHQTTLRQPVSHQITRESLSFFS